MKEEKIREKYPNIKTEEEFEALCKMLKQRNMARIVVLCGLTLICGLPLLGLNSLVCILAGLVLLYGGKVWLEKHVDEAFLAAASRKTDGNSIVLCQETVQQALRKYAVNQFWSDALLSVVAGLLSMSATFFISVFSDIHDLDLPTSVFLVYIPLIIFGIVRTKTFVKRRNGEIESHVLQVTLSEKYSKMSTDLESTAEEYYLKFDCGDYGKLKYKIGKAYYQLAVVDMDEYYLIVVKGRFGNYYKIVSIFTTDGYTLSPELEESVIVI